MRIPRLPLLCLLSLSIVPPIHGQSAAHAVGSAQSAALGHATTALAGDIGSHANPAAAATEPDRIVHVFVHESYGLTELRRGTADVRFPLPFATTFGGAGTFGFDDYRESYAYIGAARAFSLGTSRAFYAGIGLRYYHTSIASYGQAGALGLNAGAQVRLLSTLSLGAQATNLNGGALGTKEELPRTLAIGLAYDAASRLTVLLDVLKDIDFPLSVRGGLEARLVPALALRTGFTTHPTRFTVGAGVRLGALVADVAAEQHQDLGWSPSIGLAVYW